MKSLIIFSVIIFFMFSVVGLSTHINDTSLKENGQLDSIEILFIGSSYFNYNNLPSLFENLAVESGKDVFIDQRIQNGLYLSDHAASIETEQKINERDWDYVILQGAGSLMAYPDYFIDHPVYPALITLRDKIYANCESTKMVFCMPWAFEDGMTWYQNWTDTFADMQVLIYNNTLQYSNEIGFIIAPVGWAWYTVLEEQDYPLHYLHMSDWNHPSLKGSYLMACVIFSTVFIESTSGIDYYANVPEEEAMYFQTVGSNTVLNDLPLWNIIDDPIIYVDDSNTEGPWNGTQQHPYQNIQDAIDASSSGNSLYVYSGMYFESIIIDKTLSIIGQNRDTTIVDGGYCLHTVDISAPSVNISDFTILNGAYGVFICSNNNMITGTIIRSAIGIHLSDSQNNLIYNNYFNNTNMNYYDELGNSTWNINKKLGTNIIGGTYLGGNYWSDYTGSDTDGDGLGDTEIPYGPGDYLPLVSRNDEIDVEQPIHDRGFPIRHAVDGNWAAAQSFIPTFKTFTNSDIYLRKFGTPEFNLTVELRENHPQGTLLDTLIFMPEEIPSSWEWFMVNFNDTNITSGTDYFIVIPSAPAGVTTSFGYEWGYAFDNQYDDGCFWFTRDGGALWRDLPTMYEFAFRTYGCE